jgi:hypothetical protein
MITPSGKNWEKGVTDLDRGTRSPFLKTGLCPFFLPWGLIPVSLFFRRRVVRWEERIKYCVPRIWAEDFVSGPRQTPQLGLGFCNLGQTGIGVFPELKKLLVMISGFAFIAFLFMDLAQQEIALDIHIPVLIASAGEGLDLLEDLFRLIHLPRPEIS